MSKWKKVKGFCEEYGPVICIMAVGIAAYVTGLRVADKTNKMELNMLIEAKPELGPLLEEARDQVETIMYG